RKAKRTLPRSASGRGWNPCIRWRFRSSWTWGVAKTGARRTEALHSALHSLASPRRVRARRGPARKMPAAPAPRISIVIPGYNEEAILRSSVEELRERLAPFGWTYEIILAENGSRDRTVELARELHDVYPEVNYVSAGEPNYGGALRKGIRIARGEFVLCDEI